MSKNLIAYITAGAFLAAALVMALVFSAAAVNADELPDPEAAEDSKTAATTTVVNESVPVEPEEEYTGEVFFYPEEYILTEPTSVKLTVDVPKGKKLRMIVYTLDGSEPDRTARVYFDLDGVYLDGSRYTEGYSISARAVYTDGTMSDIKNRSYFVGPKADERYKDVIISINSDPVGLFSYETGILVSGKRRADYIKANPGEEIKPTSPANWNFPGELGVRSAYVEMISPDGELLLAQGCDLTVYGGYSRAQKQKSLRLNADAKYGDNRFRIPLFSDDPSALAADNTLIRTYNQLSLRNNANDSGSANARDEIIQRLAYHAGLQDTQAATPVSVYLNGQYYGFMWLKETYDREYFDAHYGHMFEDYEGTFVVLEGSDRSRREPSKPGIVYTRGYNSWRDMYDLARKDLTNDFNFKQLTAVLDVENYLRYFAIQIYVGNTDWPQNNNKIYRYVAPFQGEYLEGTVFDGRWRQLIFDTDFGLWLAGGGPDTDHIARVMDSSGNNNGYSTMFIALMKRDDCREYFIRYCYDLMNGAFAPKYSKAVALEVAANRANELSYHSASSPYSNGTGLSGSDSAVGRAIEYLADRPAYFKTFLTDTLGASSKQYRVNIFDGSSGGYTIGSFAAKGDLNCSYCADYPVVLTATPGRMETFSHWVINGEDCYEDTVVLSYDMAKNGLIIAVLITEEIDPEQKLPLIYELSSSGDNDFITLINPYKETIRTVAISVTDDSNLPAKFILPVMSLEPGQTVTILCSNAESASALRRTRANFSLSTGETLSIAYNNEIYDSVTVPDLIPEGIWHLDLDSGRWYEKLPEKPAPEPKADEEGEDREETHSIKEKTG
ncbi:MAG: hypothetical protein GX628_07160 [Clostridiales bacterium]|nr:hypothetical protein [Clostridiales bacterium]